jgi:hypothetical protein
MPKSEMYTTRAGDRRHQVAAPVNSETYSAIRRLAEQESTSIAAQVRKAVEEFVEHRRRASSWIR